jgi:hypothetical protein
MNVVNATRVYAVRARGKPMDDSNCKFLYEQICKQHDGIAEFRAKLLALLPFASGTGIFLLLQENGLADDQVSHLGVVGAFGIAVTTGLFLYELRGIQTCRALIIAAGRIEQALSASFTGAFRAKPKTSWAIGASTAALLIYPAVVAAWTYVATVGSNPAKPLRAVFAGVIAAAIWSTAGSMWLKVTAPSENNSPQTR